MKRFGNYQYVPGTPMSDRDKQEVGSKFWNDGKWDNFVEPFIHGDCAEKILVDIGCNAGIFLKRAKEKGFDKVIGVEASKEARNRGLKYRDSLDMDYEIRYANMNNCLDMLPVSDYIVMANLHYYFDIPQWLDFLDQLKMKTAHVIIVTANKREKHCKASAKVKDIQSYFRDWEQVDNVIDLPLDNDPFPRQLYGLCFKNPDIERVLMERQILANNVQEGFYDELEKGRNAHKTRYYRIMKPYRRGHGWSDDRIKRFFQERVALWEDMKKNGLLRPIMLNAGGRVVDGNHRFGMMRSLGYKTVLARRVP